jgi:hypothetical protein
MSTVPLAPAPAGLVRRGGAKAEASAPTIVNDVVRTPGRPLDAPTRATMEARLGHDFSRVRVHDDTRAAASAQAVGALAYTVGRDIVFGAGRYAPGTAEGARTLAHELVHVAQSRAAADPARDGRLAVAPREHPREREAAAIAGRARAGRAGVAEGPGMLWRQATAPTVDTAPATAGGAGGADARTRPEDFGITFVVVDHGVSGSVAAQARAQMLETLGSLRPANLAELHNTRVELHIIPEDKKLTDLPEFAALRGTKTFDGRLWDNVRGVGGERVGSTIRYAVAEEEISDWSSSGAKTGGIGGGILGTLAGVGVGVAIGSFAGPLGMLVGGIVSGILGGIGGAVGGAFIGGRAPAGYGPGFTTSHESGHIAGTFALTAPQRAELTALFAARKAAGGPWLPPEWYTSSNEDEYFANCTAAHFGHPRGRSERSQYTRQWLRENDPAMARFLATIYR